MKYHRLAIFTYFISLFLILITTSLTFIPKQIITNGISSHQTALNTLQNQFSFISNDASNINKAISALNTSANVPACQHAFKQINQFQSIQNSISSSQVNINKVNTMINSVTPTIQLVSI